MRLGLEGPAQIEAGGEWYLRPIAWVKVFDTTYEVLRHPDLMRCDHIKSWVEEYEYTEHYKVPIPFEDRHPCWIQARNIYDYFYKGAIDGRSNSSNDI